eukprot:9392231-Karenia_brevis.AAC.1
MPDQLLLASQLQVAPLPGNQGRHTFKAALPPQGPIGLLLQTAHYMAAAIDPILNNAQQRLELPPPPPFVEDEAPEQPNIYSDGAFTHPTTPVYGLATAGSWHPDGYTSSSTRAELLGLIISLYSPGPTH